MRAHRSRTDRATRARRRDLVQTLTGLGYYRYAGPLDRLMLKREGAATGNVLWLLQTKRLYHADSEDLAECGVKDFLQDIAPFLQRQGVSLGTIEEACDTAGYVIALGGRTYTIYTAEELALDEASSAYYREIAPVIQAEVDALCDAGALDRQESQRIVWSRVWAKCAEHDAAIGRTGNIWGYSEQRTCSLVNELLIEAGSEERLFSAYSGNDHWGIFLTLAQDEALRACGLLDEMKAIRIHPPR